MKMKKMNLQMFGATEGKKIIYLYRILSEQSSQDGAVLAFATENSRSISNDAESTATKDGTVRTPGTPEVEITSTSLLKKGDEMIGKLETACETGALVECWEADLDEPGATTGKYKGKYFQGYITDFEKTSNADGNVEISITYGVNGVGVSGDVTVTAAQQEAASYVYTDTPKVSA